MRQGGGNRCGRVHSLLSNEIHCNSKLFTSKLTLGIDIRKIPNLGKCIFGQARLAEEGDSLFTGNVPLVSLVERRVQLVESGFVCRSNQPVVSCLSGTAKRASSTLLSCTGDLARKASIGAAR